MQVNINVQPATFAWKSSLTLISNWEVQVEFRMLGKQWKVQRGKKQNTPWSEMTTIHLFTYDCECFFVIHSVWKWRTNSQAFDIFVQVELQNGHFQVQLYHQWEQLFFKILSSTMTNILLKLLLTFQTKRIIFCLLVTWSLIIHFIL
jgi:hypothetical protein